MHPRAPGIPSHSSGNGTSGRPVSWIDGDDPTASQIAEMNGRAVRSKESDVREKYPLKMRSRTIINRPRQVRW